MQQVESESEEPGDNDNDVDDDNGVDDNERQEWDPGEEAGEFCPMKQMRENKETEGEKNAKTLPTLNRTTGDWQQKRNWKENHMKTAA